MVVGVEQLVGALGQGRAEELLVDGLDLRVLMAFAQGQAPVDLIQGLDTGVPDGVVGADGLSAAADTAAGAGHDLDEDIVGLAALYPADKLLGVLQTVGHGHLQGGAVEVNGGLLDGVDVAPYGVKLQPGQGLAGVELVGGAQGGLHNAAGSAEDGAGAGAGAQGGVKLTLGQHGQVQAHIADELGQLPGGQDVVHVLIAVPAQLGAAGLVLLGGAGHDGHAYHVVGVPAHLLGIVGLGHRAEHGLGALGGGEVADELGVVLLQVGDPAGGAGGDHGQLPALPDVLEQLAALLHDGEIGGKVGVEHLVKAKHPQGSDHLACDDGAGLHAELVPQAHPDGGGHLDNDVLGGVLDGGGNLVGVVGLHDGPHGAHQGALAAQHAVGLVHGQVKGGGDLEAGGAAGVGQGGAALDLGAHLHAAAALDALGGVADDGGVVDAQRLVGGDVGQLRVEPVKAAAERLELAGAVAGAGKAVGLVIGEDEVQHAGLGIVHLLGVGDDLHALPHHGGAGRRQLAGAHHLHHAHPAVGLDGLVRVVAQVGNIDVEHLGRLNDAGARRHLQRLLVDCDMYHFAHRTATSSFTAKTSGKRFIQLSRADWAVSPRPHRDALDIMSANFLRVAMSWAVWVPSATLSSSREMWRLPSRQGVHWPQLSWEKNSWVMRRKPMTLVRSSTTSTAPEPMAVRSA